MDSTTQQEISTTSIKVVSSELSPTTMMTPISNEQSDVCGNSKPSSELNTTVPKKSGTSANGTPSLVKLRPSSPSLARKQKKRILTACIDAIQFQTGQPITPTELIVCEAVSSNGVSVQQDSVQRGCDLDEIVRRPDGLVTFLKKHKGLPDYVYVKSLASKLNKNNERCALIGISPEDFAERVERIKRIITLKDSKCVYTLPPEQYVRLLGDMISRAQQYPEYQEIPKSFAIRNLLAFLNDPNNMAKLMQEAGSKDYKLYLRGQMMRLDENNG